MDTLKKLTDINALQADKALVATRHQEDIAHTDNVAQTVLSATSSLIRYLEGHTSKTEVVNQLESISTPDVAYVVKALNVLDTTIKDRPTTDLTELTGILREVLSEAQQLPKHLPELPTPDKPIDYTSHLHDLEKAIEAVTKAVQAQKLVAEAPVVNVPEPQVHVDAPDLKPLQTDIQSVTKAVQLSADEVRTASEKSASGLITEQFDQYTVAYSTPFDDDDEPVITSIKYLYKGKQVAQLRYSYNKQGKLTGGHKV